MSNSGEHHLNAIDYLVFGLMLAVSGNDNRFTNHYNRRRLLGSNLAVIGIYYKLSGGRQKTTEEYLLADKQMSVIPVSFSLMASFMSAITLLGVSAENYMFGTQFVAINVSYILGTPIAAHIFLPVFYKLKVVSIYEYLEQRFDRKVRVIASSVFMAQMILYMSIVLYAPALALNAVTGLSKWLAITSVGLVCTLYCAIGGIKAVIWTDLFQSVLMFAAMLIIIVKGCHDVGGVAVVWQRAQLSDRLHLFNVDPNPMTRHTVWSLVIGGFFIYVSIYGVNQTQVQRLLTIKKLSRSQMSMWLSWPIVTALSLLTSFTGLVIFANFWKCDPLMTKHISKPDQLLPYFVMRSLSAFPGIPGLIIAGIFSGALSSVSSFVNSLAAVTLEDYIKPCFGDRLKASSEALISKFLALFYGLLCVSLTVVADQMPALLQASLTLFGVVGGPLLMLFTAGMCCPSCSSCGALTGFIVSLMMGCWIGFGNAFLGNSPVPLPLSTEQCPDSFNASITLTTATSTTSEVADTSFSVYRISYMWFAAITWFIGISIALIVSRFKPNSKPINNSLLTPYLRSKLINENQCSDSTKGSQLLTNQSFELR